MEHLDSRGTRQYKCVVQLLKGITVHFSPELAIEHSWRELKIAARRGSLAQFFDLQDIQHSLISEFLASPMGVWSLDNLLQSLYFGGDIHHKRKNWNAIFYAIKYGTTATVRVLLQLGASVNDRDDTDQTPLTLAIRYGKV